jgi:hypothetical protein
MNFTVNSIRNRDNGRCFPCLYTCLDEIYNSHEPGMENPQRGNSQRRAPCLVRQVHVKLVASMPNGYRGNVSMERMEEAPATWRMPLTSPKTLALRSG